MQKIIVSDTSCLILLDKIGELALLNKLFGTIIITPEVAEEFENEIPDWIIIQAPVDKQYQNILNITLDKGEASAIALALENENSLLIIDENRGRKFALQLGIKITGTIGILIEAKNKGFILSLKLIFKKIQKTNFRLTNEIFAYALAKTGEL